uniref:Uncharacterized protein n=1 Tax=Cacopsylla melanoneura TaxID=428564 RepID=A0A8D9E916_9HEMI
MPLPPCICMTIWINIILYPNIHAFTTLYLYDYLDKFNCIYNDILFYVNLNKRVKCLLLMEEGIETMPGNYLSLLSLIIYHYCLCNKERHKRESREKWSHLEI